MLVLKNEPDFRVNYKKIVLALFCIFLLLIFFLALFHTFMIRKFFIEREISNGFLLCLYIVFSIFLLLLYYGYLKGLYDKILGIEISKQNDLKELEIDTDKIVFCYLDKKISFEEGHVQDTTNWDLLIAKTYITVHMGNCFFCCRNYLKKEQEILLLNTYTKVKNSIIDINENVNYDEKNNECGTVNNIFITLLLGINKNIKLVISIIILFLLLTLCLILNNFLGKMFAVIYLCVLLILLCAVMIIKIKKLDSNLKIVKKVIIENNKYFIIYDDGRYIENYLFNIHKIKKLLSYYIIETYTNEMVIIKNIPNNIVDGLNDI